MPAAAGGDAKRRPATVNASMKSSVLWSHFKVLKLVTNVQVELSGRRTALSQELQDFSGWLLDIDDGKSDNFIPPTQMALDFERPEDLIARVLPALGTPDFHSTDACILLKLVSLYLDGGGSHKIWGKT